MGLGLAIPFPLPTLEREGFILRIAEDDTGVRVRPAGNQLVKFYTKGSEEVSTEYGSLSIEYFCNRFYFFSSNAKRFSFLSY